jgi:hypothetical protein
MASELSAVHGTLRCDTLNLGIQPGTDQGGAKTVRVAVAPSVLSWALAVTGADVEKVKARFKVDQWLALTARPTLPQLQDFAKATGIGFGYFLLPQPPAWRLPVPDFREGIATAPTPERRPDRGPQPVPTPARLVPRLRPQQWWRAIGIRWFCCRYGAG